MNNDLISRKWLTDAIRNRRTYLSYEDAKDVIDLIDNAPTVEVPENSVNCVLTMFGNCSYNKTGCGNCEIKDKIRKALDNERPQGEWKVYGRQGGIPISDYCSNCKYEMMWYKNKFNFCPNCGADMKGGAE